MIFYCLDRGMSLVIRWVISFFVRPFFSCLCLYDSARSLEEGEKTWHVRRAFSIKNIRALPHVHEIKQEKHFHHSFSLVPM